MSNFAFLQPLWPEIHGDCARAESYLVADPRAACIYARRAAEQVVHYLYELLALPLPYRDDLAARINDAGFARVAGQTIATKLNLIRRVGNSAAHNRKAIGSNTATQVLRELHHVMIWAAFHHSTAPESVPTQSAFDPTLAARSAPLSRDELVRLAKKFAEQDEAYKRALAERDDLAAAKDAEIAELRKKVAAAQAASAAVDHRDYSEAQTRDLYIDVLLRESGWTLADARDREYEVTGMPNEHGVGYVDYVLWGADGLPLAVIEAKRTSKSPQIGQQQASLYADCLEQQFGRRPVIYYTNGYEHWLWDDAAGYPPRRVQGFATRDELELMIQRRRTRAPLSGVAVNPEIAGRPYQVRAIQSIASAFDAKQRAALLVMATGSGKTRTVIALIDALMKAGWVKRALFLADRTALVRQAVNAFKTHLPAVPTVNLVTERNAEGRVYVSTYPTMLNLINQVRDDDGASVRTFGPGHFDLVVIDEAHRSVYAKYGVIFDWFDALLVGLTATPKDEVDHNTYQLFQLEDGVPTDAYSLEEAVRDGHLVPPVGIAVGTRFLERGIRYDDLSEAEKDEWDSLDWGEDGPPDAVDSEELNKFLFNEDTVDKVLATLMSDGYKVAGGDRIGKTIIFAKNQAHAEFIQQRFDAQWPQHAGRWARVITHAAPYAHSLIDDFSQRDRAPHIAISVDMLDTGIDVPEVLNLVFFKLVRSKTKFWQMIGRGTRLRKDLFGPGQDKQNFLVFDFCGNLEYFSQDLPGSEGSVQKSLSQRIFEARLGLVTQLDARHLEDDLRESTARLLHEVVAGMTLENVLVRPHRRFVERFSEWSAWESLDRDSANDIREHLAGLPSTVTDPDEGAKRFDLLVLRRQLAQLEGDAVTAERVREQIQGIATNLLSKTAIPAVAAQAERLEEVASDEWWIDVTLPMLELVRRRLRGLVRFIDRGSRAAVYTDFEDELGRARTVDLPGVSQGVNIGRFEEKVRAHLSAHADHIAVQRLRRNRQLTHDDLDSLEQMLLASGVGRADLTFAATQADGLGLFVRRLVGLDRQAAQEAFGRFLEGGGYTASQIRFIELIVNELTANGVMEPGRLFEAPFTDYASAGPGSLFGQPEVNSIVDILREIRDHAVPSGAA